ncbi:MAG: hypothetical protein KAJ33_06150 [Thermoplasmata archaeon]|nr:hypothetical protein [Thermoplasmata archaeon]MCK5397811.1 hypothetical protein [Thermoplasmata archaeon]
MAGCSSEEDYETILLNLWNGDDLLSSEPKLVLPFMSEICRTSSISGTEPAGNAPPTTAGISAPYAIGR